MTTDQSASKTDQVLTPLEARIIGCLMEKQRTTPDQYPLTLTALVSACNQKTARHPVMSLSPGEIGHALNVLRDKGLVHAGLSTRAERYDHKMVGTYFLSREEQALLCVLMLRGPQTLGELRINSARMVELPDLESVTKVLQGLSDRDRPLVVELPRSAGKREQRFAHLLCGAPALDEIPEAEPAAAGARASTPQEDRIRALEEEVESLRRELDLLWELTGLSDRRDA